MHEFIRVQFWRVTREKEHFDALHVLFQPSLNDLAVVDPQVIENQKNLSTGVLFTSRSMKRINTCAVIVS